MGAGIETTFAQHDRSYGQREQVLDPLRYLSTLGVKPAYLDHTDVYRNWRLPAAFMQLRERFEERHGRLQGVRHYIRVLQLLAEHPLARVEQAIAACRGDGVVTAERIAGRCERLAAFGARDEAANQDAPTRSIPAVQVPLPDLRRFDSLLSHGGEDYGPDGTPSWRRALLPSAPLPCDEPPPPSSHDWPCRAGTAFAMIYRRPLNRRSKPCRLGRARRSRLDFAQSLEHFENMHD